MEIALGAPVFDDILESCGSVSGSGFGCQDSGGWSKWYIWGCNMDGRRLQARGDVSAILYGIDSAID